MRTISRTSLLRVRITTISSIDKFVVTHGNFKPGDIVGVTGHPSCTKKGEPSMIPSMMTLVPNLHQLPSGRFGLKDQETRYRKHYLDLITNENTRRLFITRSWNLGSSTTFDVS